MTTAVPAAMLSAWLMFPPSIAQSGPLNGVAPSQPTAFCSDPSSHPVKSWVNSLLMVNRKLAIGRLDASASSGTNGV